MNEGSPPPEYPSRPKSSSGGVWKGIAIACLVMFAFGALAMVGCGYLLVKLVKTPEFKEQLQQNMAEAQDLAACRQNLTAIGGAIRRFREHKGKYPASLKDLSPNYLPAGSGLHCPSDRSDPQAVSYMYENPTAQTSSEAVIVRCKRHRFNTLLKNGKVSDPLGFSPGGAFHPISSD